MVVKCGSKIRSNSLPTQCIESEKKKKKKKSACNQVESKVARVKKTRANELVHISYMQPLRDGIEREESAFSSSRGDAERKDSRVSALGACPRHLLFRASTTGILLVGDKR